MNNPNRLTLEQEFKLTIYKQKVHKLTKLNVKKHLIAS
uniref:Uncharacterized protein ycf18 n=1 Tax=Schizymenia dubyi TaxID=38368 RepID=A0A1C9C9B9_9FLOR|nr:phycobilisome degradation protein [Schizymenia dubyi]AOM64959.1 phycobilisome degradation protein [Schizymenia dubyi]